jgi:antitoxin CptB
MTRKAKLKWHCRRGIRELDLLLDGFLEDGYDALSPADRDSFERLLDCRNEDLMDWLVEGGLPQDEQLAGIVSRIRDSEVRDQ